MTGWDPADDEPLFDISPLLDLSPEQRAAVSERVQSMRTPIRPGDPRRHHFVPRFYLERFASERRLSCTSLDRPRRPRVANVNDVAVMRDLYTVEHGDIGQTAFVERVLGEVDGAAAPALERLAYGVLFPPQRRDRINLATWFAMLCVRGPDTRRVMEALADHTFKVLLSTIDDEESAAAYLREHHGAEPDAEAVSEILDPVQSMDEWEIAPNQTVMVNDMLRIGLEMTPCFLGRHWTVVKFPARGLVTTDRPLVVSGGETSSQLPVGLATASELVITLDRSTALVMHLDDGIGPRVLQVTDEGAIDSLNQLVVSGAHREVYAHPDDTDRLRELGLPRADRPVMMVSGGGWLRSQTDGINEPPLRKGHHRFRRADADGD